MALGAASLALGAGEGSAPSYLTPAGASGLCDFPKSPITSGLGTPARRWRRVERVKVVDQEGEGRKWGFMAFLKEKQTEIQGFQALRRLSQLANPPRGVSELTCALKFPYGTERGLGETARSALCSGG